jgi:hypothetical protein
MAGQFYDNADRRKYSFLNVAIDTGTILGTFQGPPGKLGRVRAIDFTITVDTTVAVTNLTVGVNGAVAPATVQVPIGVALVIGQMTQAQLDAAGADEVVGTNDVILTADTVIELTTDQGATAGDADVHVEVDWF